MPPVAASLPLADYGLEGAGVSPLQGGTINHVYRIDAPQGCFALKDYDAASTDRDQVQRAVDAQSLASAASVSVPRVVPNLHSESVTESGGRRFVLCEFVAGKLYPPDTMPPHAARRMGEVLSGLHDALNGLPPAAPVDLWTLDRIDLHLRTLLEHADARRRANAVDERAYRLIKRKLSLLESLNATPQFELRWTHGDFEWRNVLFDDEDEVVAVIDFDDTQYFSVARDVMRCVALSFPSLSENAVSFLRGYADVSRIDAESARSYVEFYRYISSYRVWPASVRYLEPERYQSRWDDLIQPLPEWDWARLADRFADVAARARGS